MNGGCSDPKGVEDREDGESRPGESEPSETRLYRWNCPYCGKFGIQSAAPEDVDRYVVNSVRSHVRSTDGDGHGPRRQLPPGEDVEAAILEHLRVLPVDG